MVSTGFLKNKEIVVYGTGINAVKCVGLLESRGITISYMVDGREGVGRFKNYLVHRPSEQTLAGKYIVIACAAETYGEIKQRLGSYKEFQNYIYYGWLDKTMVMLHGNCHMDIIESCLESSARFLENYAIYPTPRICTRKRMDEGILGEMDVWIHEDIQSRNAVGYEVSDEHLRQFMRKDVSEIIIPHLYGLGACLFPHAKERNDRNTPLLNGAYENGMFPLRDAVIDRCVEQDMCVEQICRYVYEDNIIPQEYILDNFNVYIEKIREREKSWDIKILDFILAHYKSEKLFYDIGHPTNIVLEKVSMDILQLLGVSDTVSADGQLDYHEVPIYPWIRKVLGMEWTEGLIRTDDKAIKRGDYMDVAEYVKEYIWWCYQG